MVGVCTTVVALASYYGMTNLLSVYYQAANVFSWILAVGFAYIANKKWVFRTKYLNYVSTYKEIFNFVSGRIITLFIEIGSMFIFVTLCGVNDGIIKLLNQIIVIVLNYIFSKFWVFKK